MNLYFDCFRTFFRIGLFTIGGGYAMIPLIEADVVERKQWVKKEEFLDLVAIAQSAPGVFAVNLSIFIGQRLLGTRGSVVCALGTILPSFLIILAIALFFSQFQHIAWVQSVFKGIRPAVVALIAVPVFKMARTARITRTTIWIPICCAVLIALFGVSPIYVILAAGAGGYFYGRFIEPTDE